MGDTSIFSNMLKNLTEAVGAEVAAVRLLLSVLAAYPLAIIHRKFIYGRDKNLQHIYFITTGFLLAYLNYGGDVLHLFLTMAVTYAILASLGGTAIAVGAVFLFNIIYLLVGYYQKSTESYDINWTMPHCVLVLRLIGLAFDYFDSQQKEETLSNDSKKLMLKTLPGPLEFMGFVWFPGSFLIGPQSPMRRYQSYVNGEFGKAENPRTPPDSTNAALKRFLVGVLYLIVFQVLGKYVSDDYLITEEFQSQSFLKKHFILGVWGRFTLYKYIFCWLLAEGSCILFGITYNGKNEDGKERWDGLKNVNLTVFENTIEFNHYIKSFNINTNQWAAQYVYKRLKFLGNRHLSQLGALLFLAVWHGYHTGYFVCFFLEFLVIYMERDIQSIIKSNEILSKLVAKPAVALIIHVILRIYTFVFMGFCLLPFVQLTVDRYWQAFAAVNYSGLILFALYPIIWGPILRMAFKRKVRTE